MTYEAKLTIGSSCQLATFTAAGLLFGVPVEEVQEVVRFQEMTPVPMADAAISGLINLRGQIITAIDLRTRLKLEPRDESKLPMNVIVRVDEELFSLLVDEIGDVLELSGSALEDPPPTLPAEIRYAVSKVSQLEDKLLLIFEAEKLI